LLKKPELIYELEITKDNFENTHNRALFMTISYLAEQREIEQLEFDPMTLLNEAKKHDEVMRALQLEFDGSDKLIKYIETLRNFPVSPKNIDVHIDELLKSSLVNRVNRKNKHLKKKLITNFDQMELEEVVNEVETNILTITNDYASNEDYKPVRIGEGMMEEYETRNVNENNFVGFPSPWHELNNFTNGFLRKGNVIIVTAKTNIGKSIFLKNIVKYVGVDLKKPIFWGANEETVKDQKDKLVAEVAGVDPFIIANGVYNKKGNEKLYDKIMNSIKEIQDKDIFIEQIRGYTPEKLVKRARYYKKRHGIVGFVWDYVKRSSSYYGSDKQLRHWLGDVTNIFKEEIADPLEMFVASASQSKTYQAEFAAESQDIERHSTNFLVLRKLSSKEQKQNPLGGKYGLFVKKNRFGKTHDSIDTEWIPLEFDDKRLKFKECIN
jgi:replicative DNA helicase